MRIYPNVPDGDWENAEDWLPEHIHDFGLGAAYPYAWPGCERCNLEEMAVDWPDQCEDGYCQVQQGEWCPIHKVERWDCICAFPDPERDEVNIDCPIHGCDRRYLQAELGGDMDDEWFTSADAFNPWLSVVGLNSTLVVSRNITLVGQVVGVPPYGVARRGDELFMATLPHVGGWVLHVGDHWMPPRYERQDDQGVSVAPDDF